MTFSYNIKSYGLTAISPPNTPLLQVDSSQHSYPKTTHIPMMQARRMSIATKLASELYLKIADESTFDYAIFLSAHGEIERSFKILKSIFTNATISPTDFSMSVHNAASGISSIINKNDCETTSIAAGPDGFITAFYEVIAAIFSGKDRVLLIAFDGEMPAFYQHHGAEFYPAYAVALLIEKGNEWGISLSTVKNALHHQITEPLPITFFNKWQQNSEKMEDIVLTGENNALLFQRMV